MRTRSTIAASVVTGGGTPVTSAFSGPTSIGSSNASP
jgi:hypothetical protein